MFAIDADGQALFYYISDIKILTPFSQRVVFKNKVCKISQLRDRVAKSELMLTWHTFAHVLLFYFIEIGSLI